MIFLSERLTRKKSKGDPYFFRIVKITVLWYYINLLFFKLFEVVLYRMGLRHLFSISDYLPLSKTKIV